jgi:hypothetical protein
VGEHAGAGGWAINRVQVGCRWVQAGGPLIEWVRQTTSYTQSSRVLIHWGGTQSSRDPAGGHINPRERRHTRNQGLHTFRSGTSYISKNSHRPSGLHQTLPPWVGGPSILARTRCSQKRNAECPLALVEIEVGRVLRLRCGPEMIRVGSTWSSSVDGGPETWGGQDLTENSGPYRHTNNYTNRDILIRFPLETNFPAFRPLSSLSPVTPNRLRRSGRMGIRAPP